MQKKKKSNNLANTPKAWEFVLVRDEKGDFKYYYQGNFYSYEDVGKLIGPEEVKKLQQKGETGKKQGEMKAEEVKEVPLEKRDIEQKMLEDVARKVLYELNLNLIKKDQEKLIKIIISSFRSVRKDIEVKYMLTASITAGGLGFDEQKAELILETIKKYQAEVEKKRLKIIRGEELTFEKAEPGPIPTAKPAAVQMPVVRKTLSGLDEKKPIMSDVTAGGGLIGPTDELRTMDLVNLRRLGTNKEEIISEILERIDLLAEQSIQKEVGGIKAWQQSPVYQMYLDLGYQSIKENKPVENVINERLEKGDKIMNFEEFGAIMALNSKLQY